MYIYTHSGSSGNAVEVVSINDDIARPAQYIYECIHIYIHVCIDIHIYTHSGSSGNAVEVVSVDDDIARPTPL